MQDGGAATSYAHVASPSGSACPEESELEVDGESELLDELDNDDVEELPPFPLVGAPDELEADRPPKGSPCPEESELEVDGESELLDELDDDDVEELPPFPLVGAADELEADGPPQVEPDAEDIEDA
jgi:hypothetical protein